jgi:hypothetical protein
MMEKHAQTVMVAVLLLLLGWAGFSIIDNGKAIARVEVRTVDIARQLDRILDRESLAFNFKEK